MLDSILLSIAKNSIFSNFDKHFVFDKQQLISKYPYLATKGAAFVTLDIEHQLRGCIGSIVAHRTLLDDIIYNAHAAAFSDPRFGPLRSEELSHLTLEVSVLTAPELIEYTDFEDLKHQIKPKIDGLILQSGSFQGTFLPQVWEQLPQPKEFLEHLSLKAGANPSIYKEHPNIYRYRVDAIEDKFDAVLPL